MPTIHSTAVVAETARIADDAVVGPWCVIGADVDIGRGVRLHSHVVIDGCTSIGEGTEIYPFTALGSPPQHLQYKGEATKLTIGRHVIIRENCAIHRGSEPFVGETTIGDNAFIMSLVHIGHDTQIGNHAIVSSGSMIGGFVCVGAYAFLGGGCAIHQYVRIGDYAIVGGMSAVPRDVLPFAMTGRDDHNLIGVNHVGMRRQKFALTDIADVRSAFTQLFLGTETYSETFKVRREAFIALHVEEDSVWGTIARFLAEKSARGYMQLKRRLEDVEK